MERKYHQKISVRERGLQENILLEGRFDLNMGLEIFPKRWGDLDEKGGRKNRGGVVTLRETLSLSSVEKITSIT